MAQIGYGYGSEYQLLRFLGHHRDLLESEISKVLQESGVYHWLDFNFADPMKCISGDQELSGLSFLEELYPNEYPDLIAEYMSYSINRIDSWQSWDAVFILNGTLYLVEAKAHTSEMRSSNEKAGGQSRDEILRYFKEQLPSLPISEEWLKDYYQLANRLATTALLNKHGVNTKTLYLYFTNGFRKRELKKIEGKTTITEVYNYNASIEDYSEAIRIEHQALGINDIDLSSLLAGPVFIEAEPLGK